MTDIIERLRSARCIDVDTFVAHALHDAEGEIERLREIINNGIRTTVETCETCGHEFVPLTGTVCPVCDRDAAIQLRDCRKELSGYWSEACGKRADEIDRLRRDRAFLVACLRSIANTDYRGNRSTESQMAYRALQELTAPDRENDV